MNPYFLGRSKLITEIFELDEQQSSSKPLLRVRGFTRTRTKPPPTAENLQARVKEGMGEEELFREVFRPFREQADRWHDNRDLFCQFAFGTQSRPVGSLDEMMRSYALKKNWDAAMSKR